MKKVTKILGIVVLALILGAFIGWCFNIAGYGTAMIIAVVMGVFMTSDCIIGKKKN